MNEKDFREVPTVPNAIKNLLPDIVEDVDFQYRDDADGKGAVLHWLNKDVSEPSQNDIDKELEKIKTKWDTQAYARNRKEEYPDLAEQLDLLWHAIDAGTLDDRDHRNKFYSTLKTVKTNNPKG